MDRGITKIFGSRYASGFTAWATKECAAGAGSECEPESELYQWGYTKHDIAMKPAPSPLVLGFHYAESVMVEFAEFVRTVGTSSYLHGVYATSHAYFALGTMGDKGVGYCWGSFAYGGDCSGVDFSEFTGTSSTFIASTTRAFFAVESAGRTENVRPTPSQPAPAALGCGAPIDLAISSLFASAPKPQPRIPSVLHSWTPVL